MVIKITLATGIIFYRIWSILESIEQLVISQKNMRWNKERIIDSIDEATYVKQSTDELAYRMDLIWNTLNT